MHSCPYAQIVAIKRNTCIVLKVTDFTIHQNRQKLDKKCIVKVTAKSGELKPKKCVQLPIKETIWLLFVCK